jgi:hypothetical protein
MRSGTARTDTVPSKTSKGGAQMSGRPNIVLVHGAWADGSCWSGVIERLLAVRPKQVGSGDRGLVAEG